MNIPTSCDKELLLQAEFDGELDAVQSMEIAGHRQTCIHCQDAWQRLQGTRQSIRLEAGFHPASAQFKHRLDRQLLATGLADTDQQMPRKTPPRWYLGWRQAALGFGLGAAFAVLSMLIFVQPLFIQPSANLDMADIVVASHLRSMQADHLLDIASNNQHNVKPWFDGKIDFAPPVKDLTDQGYSLVGGRLDYLRDREIAALVYRAGPHLINVLVWPSSPVDLRGTQSFSRDGYNIVHWQERDLTIWAVSDLDMAMLRKFVTTWRNHD